MRLIKSKHPHKSKDHVHVLNEVNIPVVPVPVSNHCHSPRTRSRVQTVKRIPSDGSEAGVPLSSPTVPPSHTETKGSPSSRRKSVFGVGWFVDKLVGAIGGGGNDEGKVDNTRDDSDCGSSIYYNQATLRPRPPHALRRSPSQHSTSQYSRRSAPFRSSVHLDEFSDNLSWDARRMSLPDELDFAPLPSGFSSPTATMNSFSAASPSYGYEFGSPSSGTGSPGSFSTTTSPGNSVPSTMRSWSRPVSGLVP